MANFGETLTYWYLRLNGFFPLTNFVLHRHDLNRNGIQHRADADLLAIRLKHVYEPIGGQTEDWDDWFQDNGLQLADKVIGLMVEVKTGRFNASHIKKSFSKERLTYGIQRLGFYDHTSPTIQHKVESLQQFPVVTSDYYQIAKLLVTRETVEREDLPPCLHITLPHIENFISHRMRKYAREKEGSRFFFPDDLIQYFAWKARNQSWVGRNDE